MTDKNHNDIGDDEIRIISSDSRETPSRQAPRAASRHAYVLLLILAAAVIVALVVWILTSTGSDNEELIINNSTTAVTPDTVSAAEPPVTEAPHYCEMIDSVVDGHRLVILIPQNATPSLRLGGDILGDSTVILGTEAAGVRNDNGQIVGACVIDGRLMSKGQSKAGFCAIINGTMTIGVADTTPLLEQALESDGYFFRQYPLVVGGQVVENRPKNSSLRKALAEYRGRPAVIMSTGPMTLSDFSATLVDAGVTNAIYLIGSSSCAIARLADGERITFGRPNPAQPVNTTYLVWR